MGEGEGLGIRDTGRLAALRGLREVALTEHMILRGPNGAGIVVDTPTGRLSVISAGLEALIADFEESDGADS